MITALPPPGDFAAMVLQGRGADGPRGAVVMKAAYDLLPGSDGVLTPVQRSDPADYALLLADGEVPTPDLARTVWREADLAVEKAHADIMVEGHLDEDKGGVVAVNGTVWMRRAPGTLSDGDAQRHLFGWHRRNEEGRALRDEQWAHPGPGAGMLPPGYAPGFNNTRRRSPGFDLSVGATAAKTLPRGALVRVWSTADTRGPGTELRLPLARYTARLRWWSGDCPDRPRRWALTRLALAADTLILTPLGPDRVTNPSQPRRLILIWRAGWNWAGIPAASYRAVEIIREET